MSPAETSTTGSRRTSGGRRRASLSLEAVLAEAVELLDEGGEQALTFRALAARLGGGVGSVYHYVAGREELLALATDQVMAGVVADATAAGADDDPIANLRAMSLVLFEALLRRPWFGTFMMRSTTLQPQSMLMFDRLGQQLMRLDLTPRQRFHAVSSLVSYVVGVAYDLAQPPPAEFFESGLDREEFLQLFAEKWRAMDPELYPFTHQIADVMATHDDEDVFRSGLDLLLAGLRQQAGG